jgi:uncharacterized protein (DUF433 family)
VHQILQMLANGDTIEELLQDYPPVTREDILACFLCGTAGGREGDHS